MATRVRLSVGDPCSKITQSKRPGRLLAACFVCSRCPSLAALSIAVRCIFASCTTYATSGSGHAAGRPASVSRIHRSQSAMWWSLSSKPPRRLRRSARASTFEEPAKTELRLRMSRRSSSGASAGDTWSTARRSPRRRPRCRRNPRPGRAPGRAVCGACPGSSGRHHPGTRSRVPGALNPTVARVRDPMAVAVAQHRHARVADRLERLRRGVAPYRRRL